MSVQVCALRPGFLARSPALSAEEVTGTNARSATVSYPTTLHLQYTHYYSFTKGLSQHSPHHHLIPLNARYTAHILAASPPLNSKRGRASLTRLRAAQLPVPGARSAGREAARQRGRGRVVKIRQKEGNKRRACVLQRAGHQAGTLRSPRKKSRPGRLNNTSTVEPPPKKLPLPPLAPVRSVARSFLTCTRTRKRAARTQSGRRLLRSPRPHLPPPPPPPRLPPRRVRSRSRKGR